MSDTALNRFLASGTAAERAAFVPDPPIPAAGPDPLYLFFETDTSLTYAWDGAAWVLQSAGGTGGDVSGPGASTDKALVRWDGATGTALLDSLPILEDDGRITTLTDPTGLQDATTKAYVDTEIAAAIAAAVGAAQNSFLVSGGQVVWDTAYTFLVSAATYYINGVLYASAAATVTLAAADPVLDRLDSIAVDNTGAVVVVPGVPAAQPSTADIDPGTQLRLSIVLVSAATTQPAAAVAVLLYADNAGGPTEWNWSASGASINVNSTNSPRHGTKTIEGTAVVAGVYAQGQIPSGTYDPNLSSLLVLYIQSKATWGTNRGLQITLRNAGVTEGVPVTIARTGTWGFDSGITGVYQQIAIPITQFAVIQGVVIDQVRIADFGGAIGFYLDDISFQGGASSQPATGLTQELGDARYRRLSVPLVLSAPTDVTGVLPAANLGAHKTTHENGGSDEISVAGLSGLLADGQTPLAHASTHASAGADPVSVTALAGFPGGTTSFLRADATFSLGTGAAASGAVILLAAQTASASASLNFTTRNGAGQSGAIFQSDYDHYRIEFTQVLCATSGTRCFFRVSTDGGATWISAASSYFYGGFRHSSNPASNIFNDASFSSTYGVLGDSLHTIAGWGLCGALELWSPTAAGVNHAFRVRMGFATPAGLIEEFLIQGLSMNTSAINAIQFAMVSGNITSGRVRIYGLG